MLYNELMFNNLLRKNNNNVFILKKTLKYSFISKYVFFLYILYILIFIFLIFIFILHLVSFIVLNIFLNYYWYY